ncbi:lysozyme family protein [Methylovulum miyakonense]|uniref:lytic transglycosylase domain-containing protein n=1 Tax=Methylovulum miyakonense TaxID=645578 RepID=UPI000379A88E|nr:lytic transglycosylase domain-containing protein [Methylovulum miyakonense]
MIAKNIETAIINQARLAGFRTRYLVGIAMQESSGRMDATRFEKDYQWLWDVAKNQPFKEAEPKPTKTKKTTAVAMAESFEPLEHIPPSAEFEEALEPVTAKLPRGFTGVPGVTTDSEEFEGQKTSWGPMQVMGAVAREYGFRGEFQDLCGVPGIIYGVRHFVNLHRQFSASHGIDGVISAYNAGTPTDANEHYVANVKKYAADYENSRR